ncbi:hypothetical protein HWV62_40709 [Athelia sp. TMB]|nr:hypothetical protein HWV62_40709 [Athelia sp. TMB]
MDLAFITGPEHAIRAAKKNVLKDICSRLQLQVISTGRQGCAVKDDYLRSILQQREQRHPPEGSKKRQSERLSEQESKRPRLNYRVISRKFSAEPRILTHKRKIGQVDDTQGSDDRPNKYIKHTPTPRKKVVKPVRLRVSPLVNQPVAGKCGALPVGDLSQIVEADSSNQADAEALMHEEPITVHHSDSPKSPEPDTVLVRLYESADGWRWTKELPIFLCDGGDLDLNEVRKALGVQGDCDLIDPGNNKPLYRYTGDIIDRQEVHDLLEDERYLRIIARPLGKRATMTPGVRARL